MLTQRHSSTQDNLSPDSLQHYLEAIVSNDWDRAASIASHTHFRPTHKTTFASNVTQETGLQDLLRGYNQTIIDKSSLAQLPPNQISVTFFHAQSDALRSTVPPLRSTHIVHFDANNRIDSVYVFFEYTFTHRSDSLEIMQKAEDSNCRGLIFDTVSQAKLVTKNWGHERWLLFENSPFAVKLLHLKAGCRTSLQYHIKKEEFLFILSGTLIMHHLDDHKVFRATQLNCGHTALIKPNTIHRVEAITDACYAEASTLELDDVVRVHDDLGRPDGHIAEEHTNHARRPA